MTGGGGDERGESFESERTVKSEMTVNSGRCAFGECVSRVCMHAQSMGKEDENNWIQVFQAASIKKVCILGNFSKT